MIVMTLSGGFAGKIIWLLYDLKTFQDDGAQSLFV